MPAVEWFAFGHPDDPRPDDPRFSSAGAAIRAAKDHQAAHPYDNLLAIWQVWDNGGHASLEALVYDQMVFTP